MVKPCVLIAEDEFLIAMDLEHVVQQLGYDICGIATTAPEAVRLAESARPDLALVDVRLARGTNGLDAVKDIRERLDVPSIVISGHIERSDAERAGARGWLRKPIAPDALAPLMSAVLSAARGETPGQPPTDFIP